MGQPIAMKKVVNHKVTCLRYGGIELRVSHWNRIITVINNLIMSTV